MPFTTIQSHIVRYHSMLWYNVGKPRGSFDFGKALQNGRLSRLRSWKALPAKAVTSSL